MGQIHVKSCGMNLSIVSATKIVSSTFIFLSCFVIMQILQSNLRQISLLFRTRVLQENPANAFCWKLIFTSADHFAQDNYYWLFSAGVCVAGAAKGQMWLLHQSHQEWLPENSQSLIWSHHSSGINTPRPSLTIKINVRKWFELGGNIPW